MQKEKAKSGLGDCPHCKRDRALRNPSGFCDHLHYPENCNVCSAEAGISKLKEEIRERKHTQMKNAALVLLIVFLVGCETYTMTVYKDTDKKEYYLTAADFVAGNTEMTAMPGTVFKKGNVTCYEQVRISDGYTGCCCDGEFSKKVLDRIHRCGH